MFVCVRVFFMIILNDYDCHCSTPCHLRNYVWSDIKLEITCAICIMVVCVCMFEVLFI